MADLQRIVVLGDSVAWGQGLLAEHKYAYRVAQALGQPPAALEIKARSGAIIGASLVQTDTSIDSEIPASVPTLLQQVAMTRDPETVDLVLLAGGINDVNIRRLFNPLSTIVQINDLTVRFCYYDMLTLLSDAISAFTKPTCRFVVPGYYPILSKESNPLIRLAGDELTRLLAVFAPEFALIPERELILQKLIALAEQFYVDSGHALLKAVADTRNRFPGIADRMAYAPSEFADENALFAPASWIWGFAPDLGPEDEVSASRCPQCDRQYPQPLQLIDRVMCYHASVGHPNVKGAESLSQSILAALAAMPP